MCQLKVSEAKVFNKKLAFTKVLLPENDMLQFSESSQLHLVKMLVRVLMFSLGALMLSCVSECAEELSSHNANDESLNPQISHPLSRHKRGEMQKSKSINLRERER